MSVNKDLGNKRVIVHIKNNRSGEPVFRTTSERLERAMARHPLTADRVDVRIDWDLDHFDQSMCDAEVLMTWDLPTRNLGVRAPKLRWIHIIGAGIEHLAPLDWLPAGMKMTNSSGIHAEKTREYVVMALHMLNCHVPKFMTDQRFGRWQALYSTPIAGKTVAVIGVGKMGSVAASVGRSMGLRVIGIRRSGRPSRYVDRMYTPEYLETVLGEADFVILNVPLTTQTEGMIGAKQIAAMRTGAGLINLARGRVVDQQALMSALERGWLSGAILDVADPEPLPIDSPLWNTTNLMITPHVSSDDDVSYTDLTLDLLFHNLDRFMLGKRLKNTVRPRLGY
jgi:phosphoglycerate dehydrogenase-like enzyme